MSEPKGHVDVTWLGQAGVALSSNGTTIVVDPWLSPHSDRLIEAPPLTAGRGRFAALLATHEHGDHLDLPALPALVASNPGIEVVVPEPLVEMVRAGVGGGAVVRGTRPGDRLDIARARVAVTPAWHGVTVADGYSDGGWVATGISRFVGYALTVSGLTIYHSGDTVLDTKLVDFVAALGVEVAILPINGRDFYRERRGSVGNLDAAEALEFASEIGARVLIPVHYDMARGNTASPGRLVDLAAERGSPVHVLCLARGKPYRLTAAP
jgi:L-ascorbate 6-phosphate lactonase